MKADTGPGFRPLRLSSLNELIAHEQELLRRIIAVPNGAQLLMLDPLRLLSEVSVELSSEAVAAWGRASGFDLASPLNAASAYEATRRSAPSSGRVHLQGLFRRRTAP
jgi:hypothetical protein